MLQSMGSQARCRAHPVGAGAGGQQQPILGWPGPLGGKTLLEKGMATHSSILAWRIPWTEKPGGPQSMGLQRVGHD